VKCAPYCSIRKRLFFLEKKDTEVLYVGDSGVARAVQRCGEMAHSQARSFSQAVVLKA